MKVFSRVTNSSLVAAAMMAVIVGSLCFSIGEGLRLTPFPLLSQTQDDGATMGFSSSASNSISKYGPLDVPAQTQKRGKRSVVDLASGFRAETKPLVVSFVCSSEYEANDLHHLARIAPRPGRAPPLQS
jgi:hypothetical protein